MFEILEFGLRLGGHGGREALCMYEVDERICLCDGSDYAVRVQWRGQRKL